MQDRRGTSSLSPSPVAPLLYQGPDLAIEDGLGDSVEPIDLLLR